MHAFEQRVRQQFGEQKAPAVLAVGDGNHSLAAAKAWYEKLKKEHPEQDFSQHPARYALVELENLQDEAQRFEPIHRLVSRVDAAALLQALENECGMKPRESGALPALDQRRKKRSHSARSKAGRAGRWSLTIFSRSLYGKIWRRNGIYSWRRGTASVGAEAKQHWFSPAAVR